MLDSHRACISSCVNVCFHAGLPQSLYILLSEYVFQCWTPTELVYPLVLMCVSMLDSHRTFISSCVNVCFHAGLPQSLYILLSEYVFQCWTPTELVYPLQVLMCVSRLASHKASIYSCVNVRFLAGLPQSLHILLC